MGAWSHESFGNDDACDWASELAQTNDLDFVESALDNVLAVGNEYLEAPEASEAIAAAEVVARLQGNFGARDAYTQGIDEWVAKVRLVPPRSVVQKARAALDRILQGPSELRELWEETEEGDSWAEAVNNLRSRISV